MHKRISPHGDYDHMGEAINLVNNFKSGKSIVNDEIRDFCNSIPDINNIDNLKELDETFLSIFLGILLHLSFQEML